jgi:hypothetical protein
MLAQSIFTRCMNCSWENSRVHLYLDRALGALLEFNEGKFPARFPFFFIPASPQRYWH